MAEIVGDEDPSLGMNGGRQNMAVFVVIRHFTNQLLKVFDPSFGEVFS